MVFVMVSQWVIVNVIHNGVALIVIYLYVHQHVLMVAHVVMIIHVVVHLVGVVTIVRSLCVHWDVRMVVHVQQHPQAGYVNVRINGLVHHVHKCYVLKVIHVFMDRVKALVVMMRVYILHYLRADTDQQFALID
jgi:hypothetical protein